MLPQLGEELSKYLEPNGGRISVDLINALNGENHYLLWQRRGFFRTDDVNFSVSDATEDGEKVLLAKVYPANYRQAAAIIDALSSHARTNGYNELRITGSNLTADLALHLHNQPFIRSPVGNDWVEFIKGDVPPVRVYGNTFRPADAAKQLGNLMAPPIFWKTRKSAPGWFTEKDKAGDVLEGVVLTASGRDFPFSTSQVELCMPVARLDGKAKPASLRYSGFSAASLLTVIEAASEIYGSLPGLHAPEIEVIPTHVLDDSARKLASHDELAEKNGQFFYTPKNSKGQPYARW